MLSIENGEDGIELIYDYKDNKAYRDSFNRLTTLVYDLNFEDWYQNGCWDDRYICYSFLKDNEIIANVSVSLMDLIINGESKRAIQIGTVVTHPDYRGKGLSRALMEHVLDEYEQDCDLFFLFANSSAIDFYPKFGFESFDESQFKLRVNPTLNEYSSLRKLNYMNEEDLHLMKKMAVSRRPISEQFGVRNNQGIFMFYTIKVFPDSVYYSEEDEAIIVYQQEGHTLHLYDVVSLGAVELHSLLQRIANEQTEYVRFYFTPDLFAESVEIKPMDAHDDVLYIKANFALDNQPKFCVPLLAHA